MTRPDARAALNLMQSIAAFSDQPELLRHGTAARAEHIARQASHTEDHT